ncbi:MAG: hypothetical protein JW763_04975 [candidate division Zixibacteria bacterium]|nr:hypothetical protein [candidate division Zixibacteria bacterium]
MTFLGFGKPKHRSDNPEVRLQAVLQTDDQTLLAEIARTDGSPRVRHAAIDKIIAPEHLLAVALDGDHIDARIAAVEKIDSQKTLAEIVRARKNLQLMGACFSRITDREILKRIANSGEYNMSARRMAIENFADETFLSEISQNQGEHAKPKTPEEIDALIKKHGGVRLARALGKFRGSPAALLALGEITRRGGEAAQVAVEYLTQALAHAKTEIRLTAEEQLVPVRDPELIAQMVRMMEKAELHEKILAVLKRIDHPDARQIVDSAEGQA